MVLEQGDALSNCPVIIDVVRMVQRTGFEPAKHYALGPHPSPFDHSGTSAWGVAQRPRVFQNGEPESCAESHVPRGQSIEQILGRNDDGEQPHDSSDDANRIVAEEIGHRGDE